MKESDIQAAMGHANALTNHSVIGKRPFDQEAGIVAGSSSKDECKTEGSSYAQQRSQNAQNFIDGVTQAAASQYAATNILRNSSIMDSTVGLKAANAHMARRVAELEAEKSRRDILAQNITPATGLPPLGAEAWFETAMAYRAEIDDLTRQLAAQALAHAEQTEDLRAKAADMLLAKNFRITNLEAESAGLMDAITRGASDDLDRVRSLTDRIAELEMQDRAWARIVDQQQTDIERVREDYNYEVRRGNEWFVKYNELKSQLAMRVTPATQPTDAQQTANDVKAASEPKAFPAGALKTGGSDPRRMGPQ